MEQAMPMHKSVSKLKLKINVLFGFMVPRSQIDPATVTVTMARIMLSGDPNCNPNKGPRSFPHVEEDVMGHGQHLGHRGIVQGLGAFNSLTPS
jgi:hypothetical protein